MVGRVVGNYSRSADIVINISISSLPRGGWHLLSVVILLNVPTHHSYICSSSACGDYIECVSDECVDKQDFEDLHLCETVWYVDYFSR